MANTFPTTLNNFTTGSNSGYLGTVGHAASHNALEAKVGVDGSAVTTSHDYKLSGVTGSDKAASLTGTETLTNKRLTSPKVNEDVAITATATELNYTDGVTSAIQTQLDAKQSTLANSAGLASALSDETGTGLAVFNTSPAITTPKITTSINDSNGNEIRKVTATSSAVNELTEANAATGLSPTTTASGGDDNVGWDIKMKGSGRFRHPTVVGIQVIASATNTSVEDAQAFFRVPAELNGMNLTGVSACVYTAGTTNTTDVQIRNKTDSQDMLSTKITIDSGETDTSTAATAAVINATYDDVVTGDVIAIDVDAVSTTPAKGLYVELRFELP